MQRRVTLVVAVHHAEDLPRGMTHGLRLHKRRAYAGRFLFCDVSRGRGAALLGRDCTPSIVGMGWRLCCVCGLGSLCFAAAGSAACGGSRLRGASGAANRRGQRRQAGQRACRRPSANRARSTTRRRSWSTSGSCRRSPRMAPVRVSKAAKWKSPSMRARSTCWAIRCRTSAGPTCGDVERRIRVAQR